MNNMVCSYGCVATTDSQCEQCIGAILDLSYDELGKLLRLLQKQSEARMDKFCDDENKIENKE